MHPLDNVVWQALTTRQTEFAESSEKASRFVPEVSPLAGLREPTPEGYESLAALLSSEATIGLFLDTPYQDRRGWNLTAGAPVLQMVCEDGVSLRKIVNSIRGAARRTKCGALACDDRTHGAH
jgi:hypothetical protein